MKPHPIYELYRKQPPVNADGTPHLGGLHRVAYWDGFKGNPRKYVRGSAAWVGAEAGRDNRKANV